MKQEITTQLTIITARLGNGSSYHLNKLHQSCLEAGEQKNLFVQGYKLFETDFSFTDLNYLFINDAHYFYNIKQENQLLDFLSRAIKSNVKVVLSFSQTVETPLPDFLIKLTNDVQVINIPEPTKELVEQVIREEHAKYNLGFNEMDLTQFMQEPIENIRSSMAMFVALVCKRDLEKKGVWNL